MTMHYTANGQETVDRPQIGFTLAKEPPQRQFVQLGLPPDTSRKVFAIPPHDPNWKAPVAEGTFTEDVELVWLSHHMHARGKDIMTTLTYPDGRSEVFLREPAYDYNWQIAYEPVKPWKLPKGTKMRTEGHYNNSASNRYNPNPNRWVYWGDQTWEEMMAGQLGVLVDVKANPNTLLRSAVGGTR